MSRPETQLAPATDNRGAVLVPVKTFALAKGRLSDALDPLARARLAQEMAAHVVRVQQGVTTAVCCDDVGVAEWALSVGASVIWVPGTDLNGAVQHGVSELRRKGYESVAVAHGDLPLAASLAPLLGWVGVTLVPDRHRAGSNVISFPTSIDFQFSYGADSMRRHVAEAVRHGCGVRIVHNPNLGWDIDYPSDLVGSGSPILSGLLETTQTTSTAPS